MHVIETAVVPVVVGALKVVWVKGWVFQMCWGNCGLLPLLAQPASLEEQSIYNPRYLVHSFGPTDSISSPWFWKGVA